MSSLPNITVIINGGMYEHFAARPTLDIDFLGTHISNDGERIAEAFREICAVECEEDGVRFAADKLAHDGGCGREGRTGQDFRQVCNLAAW